MVPQAYKRSIGSPGLIVVAPVFMLLSANHYAAQCMAKACDWPFLMALALQQVYKGGIGSYGLIVMVAAFLLLTPSRWLHNASRAEAEEACNLGELLVDFFRLFGRTLNTTTVGVSCRSASGWLHAGPFWTWLVLCRVRLPGCGGLLVLIWDDCESGRWWFWTLQLSWVMGRWGLAAKSHTLLCTDRQA